jgi:hypothetical protein
MTRKKLLRIGIGMVVLMVAGALMAEVHQTPVSWMRTVLLENLGPQIPEALAQQPQREGTDEAFLQLAMKPRPAAKEKSPQDVKEEKFPKPLSRGQVKRSSKAQLIDKCKRQPKCMAKLQNAQKGQRPKKPRPTAKEESPQDKELKKFPRPQKPQSLPRGPRSEIIFPDKLPGLLSWLNPFEAEVAHAQTATSLFFTPGNGYSASPYATLYLYGGRLDPNGIYLLYGHWEIPSFASYSDSRGFSYLRFTAPATGYYILSFSGGRAKAKLRHQYGGPIIETWDFSASSTATVDYATMEYLAQGSHNFYFFPEPGANYLYVYSASLESYP